MVDAADPRFDARMDRMEAVIREIEQRQYAVQAGQTAFKWASGIIAALAIAVIASLVGIDLSRIFVLGDKLAEVDKQTAQIATSVAHVEEDVSTIADSLDAVRAEVSRVAEAVGAKDEPSPEDSQQKTELPQ